MNKLNKTLMTAALLAVGTGSGFVVAEQGAEKDPQQMFQTLDKDGDSNVSRSEIEQSDADKKDKLLESFTDVDQDNDGVLSQNELEQWKSEKKDAPQTSQQTQTESSSEIQVGGTDQPDPQKQQAAQQLIEDLDQDNDRSITMQEADSNQELVDAFSDVDEDADGTLSADELSNWDGLEDTQQ